MGGNTFRNSYTSNTFITCVLLMAQLPIMPTITYATLGAKGQIVIPKEARDKLHVGPGDKVVLIIEDGRLMIINPDGVQQMITILQEGINKEEEKKKDTKKSSKKKSEKNK